VILTPVLRFLSPETALANLWASIAPSGPLLLTVPSMDRLDPHDHTIDFWRWTRNGLAKLLRRAEISPRRANRVFMGRRRSRCAGA
jgi:hypothetical protein